MNKDDGHVLVICTQLKNIHVENVSNIYLTKLREATLKLL